MKFSLQVSTTTLSQSSPQSLDQYFSRMGFILDYSRVTLFSTRFSSYNYLDISSSWACTISTSCYVFLMAVWKSDFLVYLSVLSDLSLIFSTIFRKLSQVCRILSQPFQILLIFCWMSLSLADHRLFKCSFCSSMNLPRYPSTHPSTIFLSFLSTICSIFLSKLSLSLATAAPLTISLKQPLTTFFKEFFFPPILPFINFS